MKLRLLLSTLIIMALTVFNLNAQSSLYAVSSSSADLLTMDSTTMLETATIAMTSSTGAVSGANGLTSERCGPIYIVYQATGLRYLGTVNPATGVITEIGDLGDKVANITFADGVLLGVTGDGAGTPETLFSINTATAAMTLLTALGNGDDGESIEFNPDDGLLYHWSGWEAPITMESINLVTFDITPITLSGELLDNVGASTYVGNNEFLISGVNSNVKYVTTAGVVTLTSNTTDSFKGLVFADVASVTNTTAANDSICAGDIAVLVCNNTGLTYEWFFDGTSTGNTNDTLNATVAGAYVCEIDNGTCLITSDTVHLTVSNIPTTTITPSPSASICTGDSLELTLNTGGGLATFQWYMDGAIIPGATNSSYFALMAGSFNATKTNQNGCSDSSTTATTITVNPLPSVSLAPSGTINFCTGDSVEISISAGAGNGSFQWYLSGSAISGATNPTYFATSKGSYNLEKTNLNGCTDSAAVATMLVDTCNIGLFELNGSSFDIYPNPASDLVTIDFNSFTNTDITELQLVGIDGKTIRVFNIKHAHSNGMSINVSDVNTGIYFIRMTTSYGQIVKEIIIE
jgi:hypothetical protein